MHRGCGIKVKNKNNISTINFNQCNFHIGNIISAPVKSFGHLIEEQPSLFHQLSPEIQELYRQMPNREFGNISIVGDGILQFNSPEHYENVMEILQEDCDKWDELFSDKYAYMDFEQMDEFCDKRKCAVAPIITFYVKGVIGNTIEEVSYGPYTLIPEEKKRWDRTETRVVRHNYLQGDTYTNCVFRENQEDTNGRVTLERIAVNLSGLQLSHIF